MAQLIGCQLPSSGQWQDALLAQLQGRPIDGYIQRQKPNLRDATWTQQFDHVQDLLNKRAMVEKLLAPYSGSFWGQKTNDAWPYDDGFLWFEPVDSRGPRPFVHLVGNVAEYVYDGPPQRLDLSPGRSGSAMLAAVRQRLSQGQVAVMGGSAQSPKTVPIDRSDPVQLSSSPQGYSDRSGCVWRFQHPASRYWPKLRALLDQQGSYLIAEAG